MYICARRFVHKCLLERAATPSATCDTPATLPLCLILASICVEGATFTFSYLEGEQLINIFGFLGIGQ